MRKPLLIVAFIIFSLSANKLFSQSVANYAVTRTTGITYSSISSTGNAVPSWRNNGAFSQDDNRSNFIDIGFDFWYDGTRYTQFSVSTNGFVDFSTSTDDGGPQADDFGYANAAFSTSLAANATRPALAPFYDDMTAQGGVDPLGTSVKYLLSGTAPNRVLTIEWINMAVYLNTTPSLNFQVKLYEKTGVIEYVYGTMTQGTHTFSYTCGINAPTVGLPPTAAQLKTQQTANTTTFTNTAQNNLSTLPANNSRITFTPPVPADPAGLLTFSAVTATSMTVNWTDWATNEVGYAVYNSTDGINYYFVTQVAAGSNNTNVTGLWPSTLYYWQVYAVTEGAVSNAKTGNQSTSAAGNKLSNIANGSWSNAAHWTPVGVPTAADNVTIQNGHIMTIDTDPVCNDLTVGQGTTGTLRIGNNNTARTLTVNGNISVIAGGSFTVNGASNATHTMNFKGKINNNGILNMATDGNSLCNINFNRVNTQTIQGSGAINNFNRITLNIGTGSSDLLDVTSVVFTAPVDFLTLNSGTFRLQNTAATNLTVASANGTFTLPSKTGIWINNANATVNFNGSVQLDGTLRLTSGTVNSGNGPDENIISNGGILVVEGGTLNVAGRYYNTNINTLSRFTITGGTLIVPTSSTTATGQSPFYIDSPGATYTMTGGTIIVRNEGGLGPQNLGFTVTGVSSSTVTGGTLQIGSASTSPNQTISINSIVPVGNLHVNSVNATGLLVTNNLTVVNDVTVTTGTLNANNLNITLGGDWSQYSTFIPGTGTVTFNNSAASVVTGTVPITYNNLTIAGTSTVTANRDLTMNGNFTISSGTFDVSAGNYTLDINRNWVNNGTFTEQQGTVMFTGTLPQTLSGTSSTRFFNQTNNNTAGISVTSGTYSLLNALTLTNGDFNVTGATSYTLLSDATRTSRIAPVAATAGITGNMIIERYISGRVAGYSEFGSPVNSTTIGDWDNELLLVYVYNPPTAYPSVYSYSETLWDYVPVTSSATVLTPGIGYDVWLDTFGDYTVFNAATINTIGNPKTGALNLSASITRVNDGWNLVGNPYASHISWDALFASSTQIGSTIMIFDEVLGDYETFTTGSGVEIAPHQGFWIEATGAAPSFSFTEAVKTTTSASLFKNAKNEYFSLTVKKNKASAHLSSTTKFVFDPNASADYMMNEDISFKKVPHQFAPSLSSVSTDGIFLRINSLPENSFHILPLQFVCGEEGLHTISVNNIDFAALRGYNCIRLVDRKTGMETDLMADEEYVFTASKNDDPFRFVLKLSKENNCDVSTAQNEVQFGNTENGVNIIFDFENDYPATVSLTNLVGQQVNASVRVNSTGTQYYAMNELSSGVYLLTVTVNNQKFTHKVVVK